MSVLLLQQCLGCCNWKIHGPRNDFIVGVAKGQLLPKIYKFAYTKMAPIGGPVGVKGGQAPHFLGLWKMFLSHISLAISKMKCFRPKIKKFWFFSPNSVLIYRQLSSLQPHLHNALRQTTTYI